MVQSRNRPASIIVERPSFENRLACSSPASSACPSSSASSSSTTSSSPSLSSPALTTASPVTRHFRNTSMGFAARERANASSNGLPPSSPVAFSKESAWTSWDQYRLAPNTPTKVNTASPPQSPKMATFCTSPMIPQSSCSSASAPSIDAARPPSEDTEMTILGEAQEDEDDTCRSSISSSVSSASLSRTSSATSAATSVDDLPEDCFPSTSKVLFPPSQWRRLEAPCTFPAPCEPNQLSSTDIESCLRFADASTGSSRPSEVAYSSAPPAFFPLQRVSFAPQLKIKSPGGVYLALGAATGSNSKGKARDGIAGMMLGVTGIVEIIDVEKTRKTGREVIRTQRMIADFATDLSNGLKIWRRDAAPIVKEKLRVEREWRAHYNLPTEDLDDPSWSEMLAPGTFMLPLSMKIPCSEKLPPSFESAHYRIRYTMSLALFGSRKTADGKPKILHVHSMPFHILPSTLPTPAPRIPVLTHDARKAGFLAGISRALSLGGTSAPGIKQSSDKTCTHIVCPSIPTTSFSPGSVIPITLRIADCPVEPTDLYVRLSLIRKVYVRDSPYEAMNEWGIPDEMYFEEFCREEEEIVSRWGYVPYSIRAKEGATPGSKAQVIISDITLPVGNGNGEWAHGYSTQLDLGPAPAPTMKHGECSWFSPALTARGSANNTDYDKFVHVSTRHFISIEVGFASDKLGDVLAEISTSVPEMEIPAPNSFTHPAAPANSPLSGLSISNPFQTANPLRNKRNTVTPFQHAPQLPSFPGKLKEILIPVTIGSVAEPLMSCIINRARDQGPASVIPPTPSARPMPAATAEESADRAARDADESEIDRYERVGDDGEEAWLYPPPTYSTAVSTVPAYL